MNTPTDAPTFCQACWAREHDGPCDPHQLAHAEGTPRVATVGFARGLPVVLGLSDGTSVVVPDFWLTDLAHAVAVRSADLPTVDDALEGVNAEPATQAALGRWHRAGEALVCPTTSTTLKRLAELVDAEQSLAELLPEVLGAAVRDSGSFHEGWVYMTTEGDDYVVDITPDGFVASTLAAWSC